MEHKIKPGILDSTYDVGNRMRSISNDCSASGGIPRQRFPNSETYIGRESELKYPIVLTPSTVMVRMTSMPPPTRLKASPVLRDEYRTHDMVAKVVTSDRSRQRPRGAVVRGEIGQKEIHVPMIFFTRSPQPPRSSHTLTARQVPDYLFGLFSFVSFIPL